MPGDHDGTDSVETLLAEFRGALTPGAIRLEDLERVREEWALDESSSRRARCNLTESPRNFAPEPEL